MIKFNDKDTKEIYIGDKAISEVYCGDKLVWQGLDWSKFFYGLERVDVSRPGSRFKTYYYKVDIDSKFKDIKPITIVVKLNADNTMKGDRIEYTGQSSVTSPTYTSNFGYVTFTAIYNGKEVAQTSAMGEGYA
ncbi:hypothetical protein VLK81_09575 [Citroniella saccharovorans]|uniref:Uncharacterized protein n=1 Tax=Citroniella saccharovorans TaxID=2053367 RepID=A0AAW9MSA1_9FIRM|nr:hypothetical protein [Citroniella saccharovorans]MEB3428881.1 hypothetical protein [Citroniella saccharovorans]MEB3428928.1 hypothetical protein [Citroniella saccharovorans]MEB3430232.1 hypothetical protein [Citroniella saccharovorans]